jgi:CRP-like cAMP-binding protein
MLCNFAGCTPSLAWRRRGVFKFEKQPLSHPLTNRLIDALPARERAELLALMQPVALPLRTTLFELGQQPRYVHLITSGLASVVTATPSGQAVEVALSGREGFPEAVSLLGPQFGDTRCFMQIEGTALRMDFRRFREEFERNDVLRTLVLRYVQHEALVTAQIAACNRLHTLEQRLARWLLMVSDRIGDPTMHLTQEFLAEMVGSRRTTVTVAMGVLQRNGLLENRRGRVVLADPIGLRALGCECYPVTQRLFRALYE